MRGEGGGGGWLSYDRGRGCSLKKVKIEPLNETYIELFSVHLTP